jgi:hypothetical protein
MKCNTLATLLARTIRADNGCLIWQGAIDSAGYGRTTWLGNHGITAYRAVWFATGRTIPAGCELDHTCNTRACVNVWHLELRSHAENMREAKRRRMLGLGGYKCKYGHEKELNGVCKPCRYKQVRAWQARNLEQRRKWDRESKQRRRALRKLM